MEYGSFKTVDGDFGSVVQRVTNLLDEEGFGIITEIDVTGTLKKKLDVDYKNYRILGACNPNQAHKALQAEEEIGLLLPCNVIVFETDEGVRVGTMKPTQVMAMADNPDLESVARDVESSMERVLEKI